jgi:hypothetical protein
MSGISRRTLAAALPASALAARAAAQSRGPTDVRGLTTYSESAMVMSVSPDGRSALTLRICRFPNVNLTWLWCHVVRDGRMWALTDHLLPCTRERLAGVADAEYAAPQMDAHLLRAGLGTHVRSVLVSAKLPFHEGTTAPHGPGHVAGELSGLFTPHHALAAEVLADRAEVYGTYEGLIEVGGQSWRHQGPAKWHEQKQTGPRFGPPFCYSWLAGPDREATTLLVERGASGGWVLGEAEEPLADMNVDPPGAERAVAYRLKSGRRISGQLTALVRYEVPVYDRAWQGSFVHGSVDGRPVVGVMNDWTTAPDIYAAATARNR